MIIRIKMVKMAQKIVLRNELVKVKGRVKAITVMKEDFYKFLQSRKLRVLDKEYEALMPPLDDMKKNTIDINGLASLIQQYIFVPDNTNQTSPAQMVLTTSGGTVTLPYSNAISPNSQGVTVYLQVLQESGNYTFQYYYIGFDTTNSSYTTSQLELYVSSAMISGLGTYFTDLIRIAYTNTSFTKDSDSYLFITWLIEFQNIPSYLVYFTPLLQNNTGIKFDVSSSNYTIYFNNGNCNFSCFGNCPSSGCGGSPEITNCGFTTSVQDNSIILELPNNAPLQAGVSNLEVLFCTSVIFQNGFTVSGNISTTITPPVSGATFYVAIVTITVTYQVS